MVGAWGFQGEVDNKQSRCLALDACPVIWRVHSDEKSSLVIAFFLSLLLKFFSVVKGEVS